MKRNLALAAMVSCALFAGACGSDDSEDSASNEPAATATAETEQKGDTGEQSEFFVQEDYDKQLAQLPDRADNVEYIGGQSEVGRDEDDDDEE